MRINFSDYYYTHKLIPNSAESTLLKVIKITAIIFIGPIIFLIDCTSKLLTNRNIVWKKDEISFLSPQETEQKSFKELHAKKYHIFFEKQREILERVLVRFNICAKGCIESEFREFFDPSSSSMHRSLVRIIEILLENSSTKGVRDKYVEYNLAIRRALATGEYISNKDAKFAQIIQELCFGRFLETNLADWEEELILQRIIPYNSEQKITAKNISQLILDGNVALKKAPREAKKPIFQLCLNNARNAAGVESDQLLGSNVAELRSIHKVKHTSITHNTVACNSKPCIVYYIRHPTPTIEQGLNALLARMQGGNTTIVAPEYIGFLDALKRKNISFLYVNHQYMDKEAKQASLFLSADNNRAEAIQNLENSHKGTFHFLSLPLDGPVVKEIQKNDLEGWKKKLISTLIEEKNGFRLPKKFKESPLSNTEKLKMITKFFNELQGLYFSGKSDLNKKERRVLLVVFYSYLKAYFKAEYEVGVMASVCKDNKDRGGVSACIDEAIFNLRLGKEDDQQALHDLYLRTLAPFMIKYQEIVDYRLEVLIDLLDHIASLNKDQKTNIRKFRVHDRYEIVDQYVPRS